MVPETSQDRGRTGPVILLVYRSVIGPVPSLTGTTGASDLHLWGLEDPEDYH